MFKLLCDKSLESSRRMTVLAQVLTKTNTLQPPQGRERAKDLQVDVRETIALQKEPLEPLQSGKRVVWQVRQLITLEDSRRKRFV